MIKVKVPLVNGDMSEWEEDFSLYNKYKSLLHDGWKGKALIHELLTDDWGAPPRAVYLEGEDEDDNKINEMIPYK